MKRKFPKTPKNEFAEEEISIAFVARRKCLMHCAVKITKFIDICERRNLIEFSIFTRREEKLFCEMWKRGKKFHRFPTADGVIFSFPNGGKARRRQAYSCAVIIFSRKSIFYKCWIGFVWEFFIRNDTIIMLTRLSVALDSVECFPFRTDSGDCTHRWINEAATKQTTALIVTLWWNIAGECNAHEM